jgi:hypothetical protein
MGERTAGDIMFEAFARERGYDVSEHEPDIGSTKRPDYVIGRNGEECVVEVKEFAATTRSLPDLPGGGTTDAATVLKPVRSQLREAARQLKDVASLGLGLPLVAALTNPHGAWVFLDHYHMVLAMYGDPVVRMKIDPALGAAVGDPEHGVGRNGRLARDHQYISGVLVLSERERAVDWYDELRRRYSELPGAEAWDRIMEAKDRGECPEGTYYSARLFKTLSPTAVALPDVFFHDDDDQVFEPDDEGTAYIRVHGRAAG